jgi:hypothetical protein
MVTIAAPTVPRFGGTGAAGCAAAEAGGGVAPETAGAVAANRGIAMTAMTAMAAVDR